MVAQDFCTILYVKSSLNSRRESIHQICPLPDMRDQPSVVLLQSGRLYNCRASSGINASARTKLHDIGFHGRAAACKLTASPNVGWSGVRNVNCPTEVWRRSDNGYVVGFQRRETLMLHLSGNSTLEQFWGKARFCCKRDCATAASVKAWVDESGDISTPAHSFGTKDNGALSSKISIGPHKRMALAHSRISLKAFIAAMGGQLHI